MYNFICIMDLTLFLERKNVPYISAQQLKEHGS